jgi:hypothetical protein
VKLFVSSLLLKERKEVSGRPAVQLSCSARLVQQVKRPYLSGKKIAFEYSVPNGYQIGSVTAGPHETSTASVPLDMIHSL